MGVLFRSMYASFCSSPFVMPADSSACPSIPPSIHLCVCPSECPTVHLSVCPSVNLSGVGPSHIYPFVLPDCLATHLSLGQNDHIHLSVYLPICLSVHLYICPSSHPSASSIVSPPVHPFSNPSLSICLICSSVCLSAYPSILSSFHLYIHPLVYLSIIPSSLAADDRSN